MALKLALDGRVHAIEIVRRRPHLVVRIDGREHAVIDVGAEGDGPSSIRIAGRVRDFVRAGSGDGRIVRTAGRTFATSLVDPFAELGAGGGHDHVRAPMPGSVISVEAKAGDIVRHGDTVLTIESMKLQTALTAPRDGVIAQIAHPVGATFEKDEVLVSLEPIAGAE